MTSPDDLTLSDLGLNSYMCGKDVGTGVPKKVFDTPALRICDKREGSPNTPSPPGAGGGPWRQNGAASAGLGYPSRHPSRPLPR